MTTILDDISEGIASRVRTERKARAMSLSDLAKISGVSKAMISKIERGESSPTMATLGRLSGAFGLTLSTFLTLAETRTGQLVRAQDQPSWKDAKTQSVRTLVSPTAGGPVEIVSVVLPAGQKIEFPAAIYKKFCQTVLILEGHLDLLEASVAHCLNAGDCLELGPPSHCVFSNTSQAPCRYLVVATRRD